MEKPTRTPYCPSSGTLPGTEDDFRTALTHISVRLYEETKAADHLIEDLRQLTLGGPEIPRIPPEERSRRMGEIERTYELYKQAQGKVEMQIFLLGSLGVWK